MGGGGVIWTKGWLIWYCYTGLEASINSHYIKDILEKFGKTFNVAGGFVVHLNRKQILDERADVARLREKPSIVVRR